MKTTKYQDGGYVKTPGKTGARASISKTTKTMSGGTKTKTISGGPLVPNAKGSVTKTKTNADGSLNKTSTKSISGNRASNKISKYQDGGSAGAAMKAKGMAMKAKGQELKRVGEAKKAKGQAMAKDYTNKMVNKLGTSSSAVRLGSYNPNDKMYQKGGPVEAMNKVMGKKPSLKKTLDYVKKNGSGYIPSNPATQKPNTDSYKSAGTSIKTAKRPDTKYQNGGRTADQKIESGVRKNYIANAKAKLMGVAAAARKSSGRKGKI
jgi:hypothetical protein